MGPGRTALATMAAEPAAVDAVFPASARSRSVNDSCASPNRFSSILMHTLGAFLHLYPLFMHVCNAVGVFF